MSDPMSPDIFPSVRNRVPAVPGGRALIHVHGSAASQDKLAASENAFNARIAQKEEADDQTKAKMKEEAGTCVGPACRLLVRHV